MPQSVVHRPCISTAAVPRTAADRSRSLLSYIAACYLLYSSSMMQTDSPSNVSIYSRVGNIYIRKLND